MRTTPVVVVAPSLQKTFGLSQGSEPMNVQALVAQRTIKGLHDAVIGGFAWPAEVQPYAVMICPHVHEPARELAAVVHEDGPGRTMASR